jgi:TolA-binding protein
VKFAPNYALAYMNLAETLVLMGQPDQARSYFQKVIETAPNTPLAEKARQWLTQIPGR